MIALGIKMRLERKDIEGRAAALKTEEEALKAHVIANFADTDLTEVKTTAGTARLSYRTFPQAKDWELIYKYAAAGNLDIFKKSLHEGACKERWDSGKQIPGVDKFVKKTLKLGEAE